MKGFMISGAAMFAAALTMTASSNAQTTDCICLNGQKCTVIYDANNNPIDTLCDPGITCDASFAVNPPIPPDPLPVASTAIPQDITATVNVGVLGPATIKLDNTRPAVPTQLQSSGPGRYPLTVDIHFNATATVEALPGVVLKNVQELNYRTDNAQSINPFRGETLTLVDDVDFINPQTGARQFTIQAGQSTITLGGKNQDPDGR